MSFGPDPGRFSYPRGHVCEHAVGCEYVVTNIDYKKQHPGGGEFVDVRAYWRCVCVGSPFANPPPEV